MGGQPKRLRSTAKKPSTAAAPIDGRGKIKEREGGRGEEGGKRMRLNEMKGKERKGRRWLKMEEETVRKEMGREEEKGERKEGRGLQKMKERGGEGRSYSWDEFR